MDPADDIQEVFEKSLIGKIFGMINDRYDRPDNQRTDDNIDRKGRDDAQASVDQEIPEAQSLGAAGDQKSAQSEEHRNKSVFSKPEYRPPDEVIVLG
ncbi:hypothetical protein GGE39_000973 [Rhizobium leguminosarum]|jgi:hypothetical protein|nr:hypothetical protein [Rhizobium leguminosarum]